MTSAIQAAIALEIPTVAEIEQFRARIFSRQQLVRASLTADPFLVITPHGLALRSQITESLATLGITVLSAHTLHCWPELSTLLYVRSFDDDRLTRALAYERAWQSRFPGAGAECWRLTSHADYMKLVTVKPKLRETISSVQIEIRLPLGAITANMHPFHVPDENRILDESAIVEFYRSE